jgi:serine/threonine protein kinase
MSLGDADSSSSRPDTLGQILDSFVDRLRHGERPSIREYAQRYPDHADEILELFPPIIEVEQAGLVGQEPHGSRAGREGSRGTGPLGEPVRSDGPTTTSAPLTLLGDYRILRAIGEGGMGVVYEAERVALRSRVALKVIHTRFRGRGEYLRWFHREARAAAGLHHTNIVTVFDYGEHDGVPYYAMQFIAGHSLDNVLKDVKRLDREAAERSPVAEKNEPNGPATDAQDAASDRPRADAASLRSVTIGLYEGRFDVDRTGVSEPELASTEGQLSRSAAAERSLDDPMTAPLEPGSALSVVSGTSWRSGSSSRYQREVARIGAQIADALEYAHRRKVIHRDIKPHNILLDALGNAWITDFGLAKFKEEEDRSTSQVFAGTLRYMAPERFQGKSDGRDDIYALGATLYEFLALRPIHTETDPHKLIRQIERDEPVPLHKIDRRIHRDIAAIVAKALARNPADRYPTAGEFRDDLRRFIEGRPVKPRPVPGYARLWRWCRRNPGLAAANLTAAALTIALAIG